MADYITQAEKAIASAREAIIILAEGGNTLMIWIGQPVSLIDIFVFIKSGLSRKKLNRKTIKMIG